MHLVADLHLLRPLWLLALLPLPPLLWWLARHHGRTSDWQRACDPHLLQYLLLPGGSSGGRGWLWLPAAGWLLAVLALTGPTWERYPQALYQPPDAQVLVLSLDRSMLAEDLNPSRLARARHKIADLLIPGRQSALVVYADDAFSVVPLTHDSTTIRHLLTVLEPELMPAAGNRPEHGLRLAGELLAQAGVSSGHVILIGDRGTVAATATARRLAGSGHRVSVLAVGTPQGAPIPDRTRTLQRDTDAEVVLAPFDESGLNAIASAGSGHYTRLQVDNRDVQALLATAPGGDRSSDGSDTEALRWLDRGPWLIVLLLPLAALGFRRGWLSIILVGLLLPPPAQALNWSDLWWRSDQQEYRQREQEGIHELWQQAEQAYRAGDFAAAAEHFAELPGALGHYNRGNALVGLDELEAALEAYNAALEREPDFSAARENRDRVLEALQQQTTEAHPDGDDGTGEATTSDESANGDNQDQDTEDAQGQREPAPAGTAEDGEQGGAGPDATAEGTEGIEGMTEAVAADASDATEEDVDTPLDRERQQALEQRLRRVPDDPGGLLRRKFLHQYRERDDG